MRSYKIQDDLLWVGALDPELRVFDIIMNTPYGTTYNSYVVTGTEKLLFLRLSKLNFSINILKD